MTAVPAVAAPLHALLARAIDYAGLFPPANLDLSAALQNYLGYRKGEAAWALGRFIVPAGKLEELPRHGEPPVELSVVIGPQVSGDLDRTERFRASVAGQDYVIQALEIKVSSDPSVPGDGARYFEIPLDQGLEQHLDQVRRVGGFAKVRTGGVTAEAFPESGILTRFLIATGRDRLPFKATAGLHHPVRGTFRLTYQAGAPTAVMYGYLNLAIAAILAWGQAGQGGVEAALLESDPATIRFDSDALRWRGHRFPVDLLVQVRKDFFHGFGSCSFREPLDELVPLARPR